MLQDVSVKKEIGTTHAPFLATFASIEKEGELYTLVLRDRDRVKVTAHLTGSSIFLLVGELNEIMERENAIRSQAARRQVGGLRA